MNEQSRIRETISKIRSHKQLQEFIHSMVNQHKCSVHSDVFFIHKHMIFTQYGWAHIAVVCALRTRVINKHAIIQTIVRSKWHWRRCLTFVVSSFLFLSFLMFMVQAAVKWYARIKQKFQSFWLDFLCYWFIISNIHIIISIFKWLNSQWFIFDENFFTVNEWVCYHFLLQFDCWCHCPFSFFAKKT